MKCEHKLSWHSRGTRRDGGEFMVAYCWECGRQWNCEPINLANMGDEPQWTPKEAGG